jgi:hypothetical protein
MVIGGIAFFVLALLCVVAFFVPHRRRQYRREEAPPPRAAPQFASGSSDERSVASRRGSEGPHRSAAGVDCASLHPSLRCLNRQEQPGSRTYAVRLAGAFRVKTRGPRDGRIARASGAEWPQGSRLPPEGDIIARRAAASDRGFP